MLLSATDVLEPMYPRRLSMLAQKPGKTGFVKYSFGQAGIPEYGAGVYGL